MEIPQKESLEKLRAIVKYCNNGFAGYAEIAKKTNSVELKKIFNTLSRQRKSFAEQLNSEIIMSGGKRVTNGSTEGRMHQLWLNLNAYFSNNDLSKMTKVAIEGEQFILDRLTESLTDKNIPSYIREILIEQHAMVNSAHSTLSEILESQFMACEKV